jgi:hypothetical protein
MALSLTLALPRMTTRSSTMISLLLTLICSVTT